MEKPKPVFPTAMHSDALGQSSAWRLYSSRPMSVAVVRQVLPPFVVAMKLGEYGPNPAATQTSAVGQLTNESATVWGGGVSRDHVVPPSTVRNIAARPSRPHPTAVQTFGDSHETSS